jgi:hypothetical protein
MFGVKIFLHFALSLIVVSMFSMVFSAPEILSSISYILLVMLVSMTLYLFPGFLSPWLPPFVILNASISIFRSWMVLFNYFTCSVVFPVILQRIFGFSSLSASTYLPVFFCISLKVLLISFLKSSLIIMKCDFETWFCFSHVLGKSGLTVLGKLDSDDGMWPWFLSPMFFALASCHLDIFGVN